MSLLDAVAAGPTAQIIVGSGENAKTFHVHKKLLCDSSTYFKAALNNGFAETLNQVVTLDDEDPDVFLTFVIWLYDDKLNKKTLPSDDVCGVLENYLFKLYVFADKRGIRNLANDIITMLAAYWSERQVNLNEVAWVITLVPRNSMLYVLIMDNMILEMRRGDLENRRLEAMNLSKEFLFDLFLRGNQLAECFFESFHCFESVCHYHCHDGEGLTSEDDCIAKIEAGCNVYHELENLEQIAWDHDA